ncbi:MAG: hypothetical protein AAB368_05045, partial [bacterium]
ILNHLLSGGSGAILTILLVIVFYLLYDRRQLIESVRLANKSSIETKDDEKKVILSIVDRYHDGNLAMVHAVNEIKIVLASIQERIR